MQPGGFFIPLFDFSGDAGPVSGAHPTTTLMEDTKGLFYGLTLDGGANRGGVFYTFTPFGGVATGNFTVIGPSLIQATVPAGAVTGKVGVVTPNGSAKSSKRFTVDQGAPPENLPIRRNNARDTNP